MKKNILIAALLVIAGAAGAFMYLHLTRPSLAADPNPDAAFCSRHQIAEKDCPWCDSSLIEKMGMCPGHGVPEALCSQCNPALIPGFKAEGDWCAGHGVPESQCLKCNPGLLLAGTGEEPVAPGADTDQSHPAADLPRSQRPPDRRCSKDALRVQFTSVDTAKNAGLQFAQVQRRDVSHTIGCNAEVTYDENRYARLASRAQGVVWRVRKNLGDRVEDGDVLAIVDSADLGTAKAEYLQAQALVRLWERNHAREQSLLKKRISTEREVLEAETHLTESRIALSRAGQRLKNLGLTGADLSALDKKRETSSQLALTAPFAGTIVERSAVVGEVVGTSKELFAVADTSQMWAILDVYEADLAYVRTGLPVIIEVEGSRGEQHEGLITWISAHVDHRTRTLKARTEIANPDGMLRAGMFAKAIVTIREQESAVIVPKAAVQWEGCCNVVFVRKSDVLFEPRKVRLGYETGGWFVVEEGLRAGEQVVTTGSFLLKTELLKGSIGAGCCEIEPGKR